MNSAETRINRALRQLGNDLRGGAISAEEHRQRRRALLETWEQSASDAPPAAETTMRLPCPVRAVRQSDAGRRWLAIGLAAAAVLGGIAYVLLVSA